MAEFVVAVTGGIGSGKTAVSDRFESLGVTVVDLDVAARAVVEPGQPALAAIAAHFGDDVIAADGHLDRRALRAHIFKNPEDRRWLERLTHPLINQWTRDQLSGASSPYAMVVNPLLRARGGYVDRILVVDVPVDLQIERTMDRDNVPREQAEAIVAAQIDREQRLQLADDVIENAGSLDSLEPEVHALHEKYLSLADG